MVRILMGLSWGCREPLVSMIPQQSWWWMLSGLVQVHRRSDVALPLGNPLLPVTREEICKGDFADVFSLLYCEMEKKDREELDDKDKEVIRRR
ncbi:UNVERIFIED_CONTAM: hypothetical protein K2H54_055470 [Gekko kuhli]